MKQFLNARLLMLCVLGLAAAGCDGSANAMKWKDPFHTAPAPAAFTVPEMAEQLGLTVSSSSRTIATLRNQNNTVLLYADPWGSAFVNGVQVVHSGGIVTRDDNTMYIPAGVVAKIRDALRPGTDDAPPPRVVVNENPKEPPPVARPPREPGKSIGRVVIDPGHGGKDAGATSVLGTREKDIVLRVALAAAEELRAQNVEVVMTRGDDRFLELEDRPAVADRVKAELFVSIHADSAPKNHSACGITAYVSRSASKASYQAAQTLMSRMCGGGGDNRGVRNADYRVLVLARCPAVLMEIGFLSNRVEAARLSDPAHQRRLGAGVASAVVDYLKTH